MGGVPAVTPDIPASAVLLALFAVGALTHITLFRLSLRRGRKFIFSLLLMGFCFTRIAALSLRIVWARNPTNANIALAANILVAAGVIILFIVNLILTLRIVKALHPAVGWSKGAYWGFRGLIGSVVACLIMVVTCTVHTMFTLDMDARQKERKVTLFATVYMTVLAFLPAVVVTLAKVLPNRGPYPSETFGKGRMGTKVALVAFTSTILTLGAGFRCGVNFAAKPIGVVEWYHSRAAFYCFNFMIEIIVVYTYAFFRFEQRFYVPAGTSKPGDYSRLQEQEEEVQEAKERADGSGASTEGPRRKDMV